jgi:hypothetical protein
MEHVNKPARQVANVPAESQNSLHLVQSRIGILEANRAKIIAELGNVPTLAQEHATEADRVARYEIALNNRLGEVELMIGRQRRIAQALRHEPTLMGILGRFNPVVQIEKYQGLSIPEVLQSKTIKLSELNEGYGKGAAASFVEPYLTVLSGAVGAKDFDATNMKLIAGFVASDNYLLQVSEIAWVFAKAMRGEYGTVYGQLSSADVCRWFAQYRSDRAKAIDSQRPKSNITATIVELYKASPEYLRKTLNTVTEQPNELQSTKDQGSPETQAKG